MTPLTDSPPRDRRIDATAAFVADPYRFISACCRELGTDVFEARILLQPTLCMSGAEASRLFYDARYFRRSGAAPEAVQATLFGKRAVQGLDGAAHRMRKALFIHALNPDALQALAERVRHHWRLEVSHWVPGRPVVLYGAAQEVLGRAVFEWAGVPVAEAQMRERIADLVSLYDDAARHRAPRPLQAGAQAPGALARRHHPGAAPGGDARARRERLACRVLAPGRRWRAAYGRRRRHRAPQPAAARRGRLRLQRLCSARHAPVSGMPRAAPDRRTGLPALFPQRGSAPLSVLPRRGGARPRGR
ncbi:hypothetical protein [Pigmentiphaga sp. NML080357]|uniref:hypothetical protein n=1 Tax=Pigmentiphaga sp. NML080357 TaxID=2008675 RepID=UPI001E35D7A9|nr:hypothetical protein [Pigmentiphaga sp. NML080357]